MHYLLVLVVVESNHCLVCLLSYQVLKLHKFSCVKVTAFQILRYLMRNINTEYIMWMFIYSVCTNYWSAIVYFLCSSKVHTHTCARPHYMNMLLFSNIDIYLLFCLFCIHEFRCIFKKKLVFQKTYQVNDDLPNNCKCKVLHYTVCLIPDSVLINW